MLMSHKKVTLAALGLVTALSVLIGSSFAQKIVVVTTAPVVESHPEIRAALKGLREAKTALEDAKHDFDGHRAAALKETEAAITECEEALKVNP